MRSQFKLISYLLILLIFSTTSIYAQTVSQKLKELNSLKSQGHISQHEYSNLRQKLLNSHFTEKSSSRLSTIKSISLSKRKTVYKTCPSNLIIAFKVNKRAEHIVKSPSSIKIKCNNELLPMQVIQKKTNKCIIACCLDKFSTGSYVFSINFKATIRKQKSGKYSSWHNKNYIMTLPIQLSGSSNPERIIEFIENKGLFETSSDYKILTRSEYARLLSKRKMKKKDKNENEQMLKVISSFVKTATKKK